MGGVPSVGVFLMDPRPYLGEFWRKPQKTPNSLVDKCNRGLNRHLLSTSFEGRITWPLMGCKIQESFSFIQGASIASNEEKLFQSSINFISKAFKKISSFVLCFLPLFISFYS